MDGTILLGTIESIPHCGKCGNEDLLMPDGILSQNDLADDSLLTCGSCGTVVTYASLVAACETREAKNLIDSLGRIGNDEPKPD